MDPYGFKPVVLVVDDDAGGRAIIKDLLSDEGYPILEARDGAEAVKMSEQTENMIGLIILDVNMPGLDGITTCKFLRNGEMTKEIPIFFLSAQLTYEMSHEVEELGVFDCLIKPVSASELRMKINALASLGPGPATRERRRGYMKALHDEAEREFFDSDDPA